MLLKVASVQQYVAKWHIKVGMLAMCVGDGQTRTQSGRCSALVGVAPSSSIIDVGDRALSTTRATVGGRSHDTRDSYRSCQMN